MLKEHNIKDYLYPALCILLLVPVILFPVTTDLSIFIQSGKIIAEGGKPYVDFIDIKPPAIYYIFSLVYFIFGNGETLIRLLDFMLQSLTVVLIFRLILTRTGDKKWAAMSILFYSAGYTALAHNQTMQIESWIPLLSVILIILASGETVRNRTLFLIGMTAGLITALKFTMIFIVLFLPLADFLNNQKDWREIARRFLLTLPGFLLIVFLSATPFLDGEIRLGYANVLTYLRVYSELPVINESFFRDTIKDIGKFFGDKYSILSTFSLITGIILLLKQRRRKTSGNSKLTAGAFAVFLILTLSVIVEMKFFEYHFTRLYSVFAIFAGFGAVYIFSILIKTLKKRKRQSVIAISIGLFLLMMSPLPRWLAILQPTYYYFTDEAKYDNYYSRPWEGSAVIRAEHIATADYIRKYAHSGDKVLVVSVASSIINYHLGDLAFNKYMLSCFFISDVKVRPWIEDAYAQLLQSKWVVLQEDDPSVIANKHPLTSRQYFLNDLRFGKVLNENFALDKVFGKFYIYKRK